MLATLNVPDTLLLLVRHCPGFDRELAGRAAEAIEDDGGDVAMLDAAGVLGDHVAGRLIGPMREMQKETAQMMIDSQTQNTKMLADQTMTTTKMLADQHMTTTKMIIDSQAASNTLFASALQTLGNALSASLAGKQLPPAAVSVATAVCEPVGPVPVAHGPGLVVSQAPAARQGQASRRGRPKGSKDSKPRNRRTPEQIAAEEAKAFHDSDFVSN